MKKLMIFVLIFLIIVNMISGCEDGQIDINSASKEELQKITQIGEARAKQIIELRKEKLFESLEDLERVNGILIDGSRLKDIKEQRIACVEETKEDKKQEESKKKTEDKEKSAKEFEEIKNNVEREKFVKEVKKELDVIKLNSKSIKTEENTESLDKINYVKYGFVVFCTLLGLLFIFRKKKYKTEFN